ncbi:lipopolysaccharide biosynthesis protein [Parapedobacter deserti]|uniref:Lipopolysaccharide biosynthesis protein n=1 Tax=Parapedobacter deserti TaxID=1912957 RepID=A0ABV7JDM1_9SPHI
MVEARKVYRRWFDTDHLTGNLKKRSVKGGVNTVFAQLFSFGTHMISTAVMARLVSPEGFGVVAMVTAITGFVVIFKDLGFSSAVIQNKFVTQKQISTLFWLNIMFSFVISLIILALAPVMVSFYGEPRLFNITLAFAFSIFFGGFSLQHNALMKRQMRFKQLSSVRMLNAAASVLIGVVLAWMGFDYWAIVGATIAQTALNVIQLWTVCNWRPNLVFDVARVRHLVRFGAGVTGFDLVNYFSRNADNVLIGRFIGATALGLYSKSYQLLMLPITQLRGPLTTVALPALSTLQRDPKKYAEFYRRYVFILAFFSMPLVAYLAVFSEEVILLVLGEAWIDVAYIFELLAFASFIQPVAGSTGLVMITTGQTKRYFIWGVISAIVTVLGYLVGINWGITGIAVSYIVVNYTLLFPALHWSLKGSPVSISMFLAEIQYPLLFSIISAAACWSTKNFFGNWPDLLLVAVGCSIGSLVYLSLWFVSKHTQNKFKGVMEIKSLILNK